MKKLLLIIALTIFGLGLNAQNVGDVITIANLEFKITSFFPFECEVSDYSGNQGFIIIPSTVEILGTEYSVTSIGDVAFSHCVSLTSIEIPNSVTSIGYRAFYKCSSLTSIEIPNSVTSIGYRAFEYCSSLTSIKIPNSVTSIRNYTFYNCSSLKSIEIPNSVTSIGDGAFEYCSSLKVIECYAENVPETGDDVFYDCPSDMIILVPSSSLSEYKSKSPWNEYKLFVISEVSIIDYNGYSLIYTITDLENAECKVACAIKPKAPTTLTIPSNVMINETSFTVTSIPDNAFRECEKFIGDLTIPNSVTYIGRIAFWECVGFDGTLTLPENLDTIHDFTFGSYNGTMDLTGNVVIPETVKYIGDAAFQNCSSLENVTFGENSQLTSIGDHAFSDCSRLTSIEIPNSVTSIGDYAFSGCSWLTSIEIPNSVTSIGDWAFSDCYSLTSIEIPNSVTSIGNSAFYGCSWLTSIEIPNSVTSIGSGAFYDCSRLTSIEIPNSVTSIGSGAFYGCSRLTSIEIPNSVTSIGSGAFSDCESLTSIVVAEGNTVYDSRDNCNAIIETSSNTLIAGCQNTVIPNSVTSIGDDAFEYCSSLTSIEIPNSVTSIGDDAFEYCSSLTSITFGENSQLTSIGDYAFSDCKNLTSIEIPNSVTSIGNSAFYKCSSLGVIKCYAENVPETGYYVFDYCPSDMTIYVPEVSLPEYKSTYPWYNYTIYSLEGPRNVTATPTSDSSIELTWDESENALSYNIYRDGDLLTNITETSYSDENLNSYTEYCYEITAVRNEIETDKSLEVCAKTFDLPITTPENLVAEALSTSSIELTWNKVENALSYNIYRDGDLLANITETSYSDENLNSYTEYCYAITAVRNETETDKSLEVCAKTFDLPITTPENLVATPTSDYSIELTWNKVENALSYNIYRDGDLLTNITETSYLDENLNSYTEYCYAITAVRNETETDKSVEVCATTFDLPITTPENLVATPTSDYSIELIWNKVENALSYNIYRDGDLLTNITETSYSDENLNIFTEYCYEITAVRNETETDKSEDVCATTFDLPITTPENLVANAISASSIILTWNVVENALSYNIYRDGDLLANITETSYLDENLNIFTEYCYAITAVRNETETDKSVEVCATTFDLPITTPENLVANALSASSIILTWNVVENAESYNVYRDGDSIANVANPTYTDKDLEYNTKYCYEVAAVRGDEESEKSKMVCVKTLGESIEELSSSINIYPNPVENELFLETEVRVKEVSIYDIYGRQTMSQQVNETTSQQVVEVADLEAGVYFMKVVTNEGEIVKRFVKK